ncbi:MAG: signal peptidase I [Oscillospiraceae bacterium]|nr:signal peptidase I [Oscillospiraceae bacterium]
MSDISNNLEPTTSEIKKTGIKKEIFEWVEAIIFSLVVVVLIFTFVFRVVGVDGRSMEPTLKNEDRVLISHLFYKPKKGDIVVLNDQTEDRKPIIKRIIGTEGDTIDINFINGKVIVNGIPLEEPYIDENTLTPGDIEFPVTVPTGHIFVLGDNRNNSLDSRHSEIGMADSKDLLGRAFVRIYPIEKIGFIK